jgi:chaperonin cofactor prefoldin
MRNELAQTADALQNVTRERDDARTRLAEADSAASDVAALKDEREMIRTRVSSLLAQIEDLNL